MMWLVVVLAFVALLLAALIVVLLANELKVKRTADDYAQRFPTPSFDRERLGA